MAYKTLRGLLAATLTALAANCFLKYLWWTASYSAWSSIQKMPEQSRTARANAAFNGWSFLALEAAALIVAYSLIRLREWNPSGALKTGVRLALSLVLTIAATAVLAFILSWIKQGA